ncbi:MAG: pyridoxal-phosphate dependent enzyme, partial [Pseudomonadota bacterium]
QSLCEGLGHGTTEHHDGLRAKDPCATVDRVDGSYEESVAHAAREAERHGWFHLADGAWEGYIDPPALVMEGYTVIADECRDVFAAQGVWPTHVLLQAGVGGLAAAVAARIRDNWPVQPRIVVVEPDEAPCLMQSVAAGEMTTVSGSESNMGRLDCKTPSLIAYEALHQDADTFVVVSDADAEETVALIAGDGFASTPSGAAGLTALRVSPAAIGADAGSRVLTILSEGAVG